MTVYNERVCPICSAMDEEKRNMDEPFSNGKMLPPGHPSCRCAVVFEEIEGTNLGLNGGRTPDYGIVGQQTDEQRRDEIPDSMLPPIDGLTSLRTSDKIILTEK